MTKYISIRSGASALPENSVAHLTVSLIGNSGVEDLDNDFKVTENNPQDLSVNISTGRAFFVKTSMVYHGYSTASENVSIDANSSGDDRIDAIVAYVDLGAVPNNDGSNVMKFEVVKGTPATSPVPPTDTEIQASVGAGNPFIRLAEVYVSNGATAISNSNITDKRVNAYVQYKGGFKDVKLQNIKVQGSYQDVNDNSVSGSITLDCSNRNVFILTLTGDVTVNLSNYKKGQSIYVIFTNGESYNVTWDSSIKWSSGSTPACIGNYNGFILFAISTTQLIGVQTFYDVTL